MLVTTHSMVAMALTVTTGNPYIYVPAAVVNHPILDMLPHFGFPTEKYPKLHDQAMWPMVLTDMIAGTSLFFLVLAKTGLPFWLLFGVCFLAAWPDLFTFYQRKVNPNLAPGFLKLHERIQHESPWYFWVDLTVIAVCIFLIFF